MAARATRPAYLRGQVSGEASPRGAGEVCGSAGSVSVAVGPTKRGLTGKVLATFGYAPWWGCPSGYDAPAPIFRTSGWAL